MPIEPAGCSFGVLTNISHVTWLIWNDLTETGTVISTEVDIYEIHQANTSKANKLTTPIHVYLHLSNKNNKSFIAWFAIQQKLEIPEFVIETFNRMF